VNYVIVQPDSTSDSTSFPLPFVKTGPSDSRLVDEPDNCHEGIDGRGGIVGKGGAGVDVPGVRLNNNVLRDLRSCCSSPNDCV
jgi:hypothetical protein